MPIPQPRQGEDQDKFIARCMADPVMRREYPDQRQRAAICYGQWRGGGKRSADDMSDELLKLVKERGTDRRWGITTADRYVLSMQDLLGLDRCYRYASRGQVSFHDVLEKAAKTLIYTAPELAAKRAQVVDKLPKGVKPPKNTLLVFRHTLVSSRKDRDGDVMHPEGAVLDGDMLLLFQHIPTMPIGRFLVEGKRTAQKLSVYSCIVDLNNLAHDCAVMVENGMGRFSYGFKALEFDKIKAKPAGGESDDRQEGYEVTKFEVMEESLVSVPANPDARTEEVLLSLVEGGKLSSPVMKELGKSIRKRRAVRVPVTIDLKVNVKGEDKDGRIEREKAIGEADEPKATETGSPGQTDGGGWQDEDKRATVPEVKREALTPKPSEFKATPFADLPVVREPWAPDGATDSDIVKEILGPDGDDWAAARDAHLAYAPGGGRGNPPELVGAYKLKIARRVPHGSKTGKLSVHFRQLASRLAIINGAREGVDLPEDVKRAAFDHGLKYYAKLKIPKAQWPKYGGGGKSAVEWYCDHMWGLGEEVTWGELVDLFGDAAVTPESFEGQKLGRVLSKANEKLIRDAIDNIQEVLTFDGAPRAAKSLLREALSWLKQVLKSLGEAAEEKQPAISMAEAVGFVLAKATNEQRERLRRALEVLHGQDEAKSLANALLSAR